MFLVSINEAKTNLYQDLWIKPNLYGQGLATCFHFIHLFFFVFADAFATTNIITIPFQWFIYFWAFQNSGLNTFQIDGLLLIVSKKFSMSEGIISKIVVGVFEIKIQEVLKEIVGWLFRMRFLFHSRNCSF